MWKLTKEEKPIFFKSVLCWADRYGAKDYVIGYRCRPQDSYQEEYWKSQDDTPMAEPYFWLDFSDLPVVPPINMG